MSAYHKIKVVVLFLTVCLLILMAVAASVLSGAAIYHAECVAPKEEAWRILVPRVKFLAKAELEKTGTLDGIDRILRKPGGDGALPGKYRVYVRHAQSGDEVVIEPRHLSICRPTFILSDHSRNLKVIGE